VRECARLAVGSAKGRVAELRSLLRFLQVRGLTALAEAVPPVAGWRETGIPRTMARGEAAGWRGSLNYDANGVWQER